MLRAAVRRFLIDMFIHLSALSGSSSQCIEVGSARTSLCAATARCGCAEMSVNAVSFAPLGLRAFARGMNDLTSFLPEQKTSSGHEVLVGGLTKKKKWGKKSNKQAQRSIPPAQTVVTRKQGVSLARLSLPAARAHMPLAVVVPHRCGRVFKPAAQL